MLSKIKKRIADLEQENKRLLWLIDNPKQYKIGDKKDGGIIYKITLEPIYKHDYCGYFIASTIVSYKWEYSVIKPNKK